jgi:hypothetical protein
MGDESRFPEDILEFSMSFSKKCILNKPQLVDFLKYVL